jgi:hypothetical protein
MKFNLDADWKTSEEKEKEGFWHEVQDGVRIRVRRFGGRNYYRIQEARSKFFDPHIKGGKRNLSEDQEDILTKKSFAYACISDWEGIECDGESYPFSQENAAILMNEFPDLYTELMLASNNPENFRVEVGNC